jgi:hypothetical protein
MAEKKEKSDVSKAPKVKEKFMLEVQCLIPSIMYLETWAEDEKEALKNLELGKSLTSSVPAKQFQTKARFQKVKIKNIQNMIKLTKNY